MSRQTFTKRGRAWYNFIYFFVEGRSTCTGKDRYHSTGYSMPWRLGHHHSETADDFMPAHRVWGP